MLGLWSEKCLKKFGLGSKNLQSYNPVLTFIHLAGHLVGQTNNPTRAGKGTDYRDGDDDVKIEW